MAKKKKPYKYLELYFRATNHYRLGLGLCKYLRDNGIDHSDYFELFKPTPSELNRHTKEGYGICWWGSDYKNKDIGFTPLRQNIVLLMAAMNGEL